MRSRNRWQQMRFNHLRRREFVTLLGGAAAAWPLAARAQQPDRMRRIGKLMAATEDHPETKPRLAAFRQGLKKLGWSERRNVRIDARFTAAANSDQARVLAKELVTLQPDVIVAHSTPIAAAFQRESGTIPIVFLSVSDPIGSGFIASLARPGGNLTGPILSRPPSPASGCDAQRDRARPGARRAPRS
jgi:putative ABC transport system substrate-binding protein